MALHHRAAVLPGEPLPKAALVAACTVPTVATNPGNNLQSALAGHTSRRARKASVYWRRRQEARKNNKAPGGSQPTAASQDVCPISFKTVQEMLDPVVSSDGFIYEAESLYRWLEQKRSSPVTREDLSFGVPLRAAQRAVQRAENAKASQRE